MSTRDGFVLFVGSRLLSALFGVCGTLPSDKCRHDSPWALSLAPFPLYSEITDRPFDDAVAPTIGYESFVALN